MCRAVAARGLSSSLTRIERVPGDAPQRDNQLADDELITAIELPADHLARPSHYLKVRDRASYAFALFSVAAALELQGDTIVEARLALGGVAHKPWRARAVEAALIGQTVSRETFAAAAEAMLQPAEPLEHTPSRSRWPRPQLSAP